MIKLDLPVKKTKECEIVDAKNRIVVPSITFRGDVQHIKRQDMICDLIVQLINAGEARKPKNAIQD